MSRSVNWWTRKLHRWGAVLIAMPLLIVIVSGLMLQLKKQVTWIQPPTSQGSSDEPSIAWEMILVAASQVADAKVNSWDDIDRLDVRIDNGVTKVQCRSGWELQLDSATGELLSSAYRRSDLIENIHDGSFFTEPVKLWVFLPNGLVLLCLWISGLYLWYIPFAVRRRKNRAGNKLESEAGIVNRSNNNELSS